MKVSSLCLGAMTFGEADEGSFMHKVGADEATSQAVLDRSAELGVNFVDTADVYGQDGLSERVLGNYLAARGSRDRWVVATKFRFTMGSGPNKSGASRYRIIKCCEDSLRRLRTDRIDLYQIHMQDITTPEEETLRALDDLVRAGKILYAGCSNYAAYRLVDSLWKSRTAHGVAFATLQAQYSLVVRDLEREHVPLCRAHGLGILPWSPLAGGFLSGKYAAGGAEGRRSAFDFPPVNLERGAAVLAVLGRIAQEKGCSMAQAALAWLLHRPVVTSVIVGAKRVEQLQDNIRSIEVALSDADMAALDAASALPAEYPGWMLERQGEYRAEFAPK